MNEKKATSDVRPTHLLGFEGIATTARTPMWASPVLGDDDRRMMVVRDGSTYEHVADHAWVCPTSASELERPLPIEVVAGHGCLVLDREDVRLAGDEKSSSRSSRFLRFARSDPDGPGDPAGTTWLNQEFVVWYCSPDEAQEVRELVFRGLWKSVRELVSTNARSERMQRSLRDLAFRLQRSASRRLDWAYAIAALERADETKLADRTREVVLRDVDRKTFDDRLVRARDELSTRVQSPLRRALVSAREGQMLKDAA